VTLTFQPSSPTGRTAQVIESICRGTTEPPLAEDNALDAASGLVIAGQKTLKVGSPYVLGLYSSGGGGHVSALDSIETCLQPCIDVRRVAPLRDILHRIDPIAQLTLGRLDGELLFNKLAERGNTGLLGALEKVGTRRVRTKRRAMAKLFHAAFAEHPPTLIVSTMPFINAAVSDVAHAMGIPFVVVPTDYDLTNFVVGLPTPLPAMQHVIHAFSDQASQHAGIHLGYPLRPQFAQPITQARYLALRAQQGIPVGSRVIVITVGSAGGVRALDIAKRLATRSAGKNYHLIICCGRNRRLLLRAQALHCPGVTIEARGYTSDMVSLLGKSDLLITKPGGGTVMEALALGVPLAIDAAAACVPWERANLKLAGAHGASMIEAVAHVPAVVAAKLARPRNFGAAAPFPNFQEGFRTLVASLLAKQ
jgi:UDP-N-acetylglucosamine:LPS N-acetylglucosamine transferase